MTNAFPYILLILFYGVLAILHKYYFADSNKTKFINICSFVVFVLFFGFRGFVAYDWTAYYFYYFNIPTLTGLIHLPFNKWPTEPGFSLLLSICKTIYPDYIFFQATCTIINYLLLTRFIKRYTTNIQACLVLFLVMNGFGFSIDLMRNSLSILIFLNAIEYIEKKKTFAYFVLCAIAASFHTSAFAYFPIYFIINRKYNKRLLLCIFIAANIICVFHIPIFRHLIVLFAGILSATAAQYIDQYMSFDAASASIFSIGYLERLATGIMLFCYMDKLCELRKTNVLVNSMFLYLIINLFLSEFRTISIRCSNLFIFSYWIIWLDYLKCIYYKSNKYIYITFICLYCLLKTYSGNMGAMSQYYNVLFDYKTHTERMLYFKLHLNDKN